MKRWRRKKQPTLIVHVKGVIDPVETGRQIERVMQQYARATGRPLQIRTLPPEDYSI